MVSFFANQFLVQFDYHYHSIRWLLFDSIDAIDLDIDDVDVVVRCWSSIGINIGCSDLIDVDVVDDDDDDDDGGGRKPLQILFTSSGKWLCHDFR